MDERDRFKIAFPCITLPENRGGRRAIIMSGLREKGGEVVMVQAVDITGQMHFNVPYAMSEIQQLSKPCVLVEDPNARAPRVGGGSGLIGPNGQPL